MKILNANVSMYSEHALATHSEARTSLQIWSGPRTSAAAGNRSPVSISDAGRAAQAADTRASASSADRAAADPRLALILAILERLTGRRLRVFDASALQAQAADAVPASAPTPPTPQGSPSSAGFGIAYEYHASYDEAEQTSFSAQGVVQTADGKTIQFQLDLSMARQYHAQVDISFHAGDAPKTDPLVINFDGNAAQLTDQRFAFDLNADGNPEQLPMLAAGSGYLALDRNGNGSVDSGAELFGPATGSGFGELAALDADHNGWIDENDPDFARLRVWVPDGQGGATVSTLAERQVGALYLGNIATPFALKGTGNADLGAVAASGAYVTESGAAGTLQEIDLSV